METAPVSTSVVNLHCRVMNTGWVYIDIVKNNSKVEIDIFVVFDISHEFSPIDARDSEIRR